MRTIADLEWLAADAGCALVRTRLVGGELVGELMCADSEEGRPMTTARLLEGLTATDDPADLDPAVVLSIRSAGPLGPRAAVGYVQQQVRYEDEEPETFAAPAATLRSGVGDCDDSERALVSLARAAGIPARLVFFLQDGSPAHVTAQLYDAGRWRWAETTIPARYGEHPFAAMRRLHLQRADLDGVPFVFELGQWRPLKGQTMGQASALPGYLGDTFPASLVSWSQSIGADPLDVLKLLLSESGLQPSARNSTGFPEGEFAVGLNQLAPVNWGYFSPMSADDYAALTAEQQLPYVFAYFSASMKAHGLSKISGRDLYWLNFLPATFVPFSTDLHQIVDSSSPYYAPNAGLDHGGKGYITAGDLQKSLDAQEAAHPTLWPLVSGAIRQNVGGASGAVAAGVVVVSVLLGALLARFVA